MFIRARVTDRCGLKSIKDQVSTDIYDVVQASKSNLTARGVAIDLLQMAKRVRPQCEDAEHEDLSGEEGFSFDSIVVDVCRGHQTFCQRHSGTLNESTNVGVKTGGTRVGGPELCV